MWNSTSTDSWRVNLILVDVLHLTRESVDILVLNLSWNIHIVCVSIIILLSTGGLFQKTGGNFVWFAVKLGKAWKVTIRLLTTYVYGKLPMNYGATNPQGKKPTNNKVNGRVNKSSPLGAILC